MALTIHIAIFFLECEDRYHGNTCIPVCGQCINGEMCDKYNGKCVNGCEPNFKTPLCQGIYKSENVWYSKLEIILQIYRNIRFQ